MKLGLIFIFLFNPAANADEVVNKARRLFIEKNRKEALTLIEKALPQSKDKKALIKEGEKLASRFKTDEAQREFELAESLYFSQQGEAAKHYEASKKLEPNNIQITYSSIRLHLSQGECESAKEELIQLKEVWRHAKLMPYYRLRVSECEGQSLSTDKVDELDIGSPYLKKMQIQAFVDRGRGADAMALSKNLDVREKVFAEIYYLLFKAGELESGGQISYLRKYLKLCQSYGAVERRSFELEPLLCAKANEAQRLVKSLETGGV